MTKQEIKEQFKNFDADKHSLIISSISDESEPLTSYAPFVKEGNNYFISISSKLPHFKNMQATKKVHILIIEDEASAEHIYVRKRLYFSAACEVVEMGTEEVYRLFDKRYGESLSFLRSMNDFKIIKFTPREKSLVLGFGAAYKMGIDGEIDGKSISHN